MAGRRGLINSERLALNFATVTADAALVSAPCFVYQLIIVPRDTSVTGLASIADTSAAADAVKETSKIEIKLGAGALSAANQSIPVLNYNPPLYIATKLFADITNTTVSVAYLPAS